MKCPNCLIELMKVGSEKVQCAGCGFNTFPNTKIMDRQYIWLSVDRETGNEGVIALNVNGVIMTAMNSDLRTALQLESIVRAVSNVSMMDLKLVEFIRHDVTMDLSKGETLVYSCDIEKSYSL